MLVLSRNPAQRIVIKTESGERIIVENVGRDRVRLAFEAPKGVRILREELERRKVE